jgi:PAP2 superfamily protein
MKRTFTSSWQDAWRDRPLRLQIVATPLGLVLVLHTLARFLVWIEKRPGVRLSDPLLNTFEARDCTWLVFGVIYLALVAGLAVLAAHPRVLVQALQAYLLMLLSRMWVMYFMALDPPADMIPLRDPVIEIIGTGRVLTRDLFFSGHTSTLFLLLLAVTDRRVKPLLLACVLTVAVGLLRQHVHYTVDVLVAPLFSFASYRTVLALHNRSGSNCQRS